MAKIDPKVLQVLGLGSSADNHTIATAMFKKFTRPLATLQNRVCQRAKLSTVTIGDADPKASGKQPARIDLRISSGDNWETLATKFATLVMRGPGAVTLLTDEARRMVLGMPVGATARALDNGDVQPSDELVSDSTLAILPHRIFGIDDAVVLTAGVAFLVAIVPFVLPLLIELGKGAFDMIVSVATGQPVPPAGGAPVDPGVAPPANVFDAAADKVGLGTPGVNDTPKVLAVVAVLVVGYIIFSRMKKKGG